MIWYWVADRRIGSGLIMAASQQSNVPIIFSLTTLTVLLTLPLIGMLFWMLFWMMFVRLDLRGPDKQA